MKKTEYLNPRAIAFKQKTAYKVDTWKIGHLNYWNYY